MEYKGGPWKIPEECIVRTAVCQKAPARLKHRQAVKKMKPAAFAVIELCCSEGIGQLVSQSVS